MPTPQPPSTGPTSAPASRWTSSKKTSLKCASPEIWRSGRMVTPSASIGTTNIVRPLCLGTSGLVRASSRPNVACWAFVVHTFWPESRQEPSSCCLARVCTPARSEPAAGSEKSWHQTSSAVSIGPRWRCFWSSEPCAMSVGPEHAHADDVEDPRHVGAADLLVDDHLLERAEAGAAVLGGPGHGGQPALGELASATRGGRSRTRRPPRAAGARPPCAPRARPGPPPGTPPALVCRSGPRALPVERLSSGEELWQSGWRCCSASPRRARAPSCWPGSRAAARAGRRSRPRGRASG